MEVVLLTLDKHCFRSGIIPYSLTYNTGIVELHTQHQLVFSPHSHVSA